MRADCGERGGFLNMWVCRIRIMFGSYTTLHALVENRRRRINRARQAEARRGLANKNGIPPTSDWNLQLAHHPGDPAPCLGTSVARGVDEANGERLPVGR